MCFTNCLFPFSKPAQLEGLEVDQYMWGILTTLNTTEVDEVTIDSSANWRPAKNPGMPGIKQEPGEDGDTCGGSGKKANKPMSPSSMTLPTLNSWDNLNSAMSPYMPLDMNSKFLQFQFYLFIFKYIFIWFFFCWISRIFLNCWLIFVLGIASGSMMSSVNNNSGGMQRTNSYELLNSPMSNKYGSGTPLSHLTDSVNCLDPLNAMEKSLADQVGYVLECQKISVLFWVVFRCLIRHIHLTRQPVRRIRLAEGLPAHQVSHPTSRQISTLTRLRSSMARERDKKHWT